MKIKHFLIMTCSFFGITIMSNISSKTTDSITIPDIKTKSSPKTISKLTAKELHELVKHIDKDVVIFDLTGVLLHPSKRFIFSEVGPWELFKYCILNFQLPYSVFHRLTNFLEKLAPASSEKKYFYKDQILPEIICQWQKGELNSHEILEIIKQKCESEEMKTFFASTAEKNLILKMANIIFTPKLLAKKSIKRIESGIAILKALANKRNEHGEKRHTILGLSNMEEEIVKEVHNLHPDIFGCFDGMMISSAVHMMKPDEEIYQHFLKTFNLNPKDCIFFDDQKENIVAAEKLGIQSIQFVE